MRTFFSLSAPEFLRYCGDSTRTTTMEFPIKRRKLDESGRPAKLKKKKDTTLNAPAQTTASGSGSSSSSSSEAEAEPKDSAEEVPPKSFQDLVRNTVMLYYRTLMGLRGLSIHYVKHARSWDLKRRPQFKNNRYPSPSKAVIL